MLNKKDENDLINKFNKKKIIKDIDDDINDITKKIDENLRIQNICIYIFTHNICSPEKYVKDLKYLNLTSILVTKNNIININKINNIYINKKYKKYIKYKVRLKYRNRYFIIYFKKEIKFIRT